MKSTSEYRNKTSSEKEIMLAELSELTARGIALHVEGEVCTPREAAETMCMREPHCYMRDYIFEGQTLSEVHFDRIYNSQKTDRKNPLRRQLKAAGKKRKTNKK